MTNQKVDRPNLKIVVLDFETNGFDPLKGNKATEIGAVQLDGKTGEVMGEFDALIKTGQPQPNKIVELTGITDEMLEKHGLEEGTVKLYLQRMCKGAIVVAHNANFDFSYLKYQFDIEPKYFYDTLTISRALYPEEKVHKLGVVCERAGIELTNAHRAIFDTRATAELLNLQLNKTGIAKKYINTISKKGLRFKPSSTLKVI